jgi:hypothetical protein
MLATRVLNPVCVREALRVLRNRCNFCSCSVGIQLSTVEVRFEDLDIEAEVFLGARSLPSVTNRFIDYIQVPHSQHDD